MRLSELLAPQVSNRSRTRGIEYFATGAVTHIERRDGIVHATVKGEQKYDVWIESVGSRLRASCTCPHFIDHFQICKHIWAVVLLAEKRGIPLIGPGPAPANVRLEPVDFDDPQVEDEEDDFEDEFDELDELDDQMLPWAPPAPPSSKGRTPPAPKTPLWQQQLARIAAVPHATHVSAARPAMREGQLLYVLDIEASLAAGALVVELMTRDRKANGEWGAPRAART